MQRTAYNLARLRKELKPFRLYWFPRLRSTNDHAATLRKRGDLFAPAIVLTSRQTAGRGRGRHSWWLRPGCIAVTFVLPIEEHLSPTQVPLIAGLAVRNAAAELTGQPCLGLKWPNDVVYDGLKLAGLLCERIHKADLIGVGLNVNVALRDVPRILRPTVGSLCSIASAHLDMTDALLTLAGHMARMLAGRKERPFAQFLKEYDRNHVLVGQEVAVQEQPNQRPTVGSCEGIDHLGRLLVRGHDHLHRIAAGHVLNHSPATAMR